MDKKGSCNVLRTRGNLVDRRHTLSLTLDDKLNGVGIGNLSAVDGLGRVRPALPAGGGHDPGGPALRQVVPLLLRPEEEL